MKWDESPIHLQYVPSLHFLIFVTQGVKIDKLYQTTAMMEVTLGPTGAAYVLALGAGEAMIVTFQCDLGIDRYVDILLHITVSVAHRLLDFLNAGRVPGCS